MHLKKNFLLDFIFHFGFLHFKILADSFFSLYVVGGGAGGQFVYHLHYHLIKETCYQLNINIISNCNELNIGKIEDLIRDITEDLINSDR